MSRNKGATFERGIANDMKVVIPEARRGIGQTRSASEVCDVDGTPFWKELKNKKALSLSAVMNQAREQTDGRPPVLVVKHGRGEILACIPWAFFLRLLEELKPLPDFSEWPFLPVFQAGQIAEAQAESEEIAAKSTSDMVGDWVEVMLERQRTYVEQEKRRRAKPARKKKAA